MPTLNIGQTTLDYDLRRSDVATERKITVTPERIEVLVLSSDGDEEISRFLERKREWLFNAVRDLDRVLARRHVVPRFISGSKIPYRGRRASLTVQRSDCDRAIVTYRNGFVVELPHWAGNQADHLVASELRHWLKRRARHDVEEISSRYGKRYGLPPKSVRVADLKGGWGSCGRDGNIIVHWHLVFAPKRVLEYVVVHEMAHLKIRTHGPEFWHQVEAMMPSFQASKDWLEHHQGELSAEFLDDFVLKVPS